MAMRIRIGTRKTKLAMVQTQQVVDKLAKLDPMIEMEIVPIITTGDKITDKNLYDIGGKALFLKEIETSLLAGKIDIAVHSLKDVPGVLPPGLEIVAVLEREDPRDVFVSTKSKRVEDLPKGAVVGSSSVRRKVLLHKMRPDLEIVQFRGTVPTRLDKVLRGDVDATILAAAGLKRLDMLDSVFCYPIDTDQLLPAAGQGMIAIEIIEDNEKMRKLLAKINHEESWVVSQAERSFLKILDASCHTPISAYAEIEYGRIKAKYMHADFDGSNYKTHTEIGTIEDAPFLGKYAAQKMDIL